MGAFGDLDNDQSPRPYCPFSSLLVSARQDRGVRDRHGNGEAKFSLLRRYTYAISLLVLGSAYFFHHGFVRARGYGRPCVPACFLAIWCHARAPEANHRTPLSRAPAAGWSEA